MTSHDDHTKSGSTVCVFDNITPEPYISNVPAFDFGNALAENYPLLRLIFRYLPYDDLQNCAEVSESWNSYAEEQLARYENKAGLFSFYKTAKKGRFQLQKNLYGSAACGLIFCKQSFFARKYICLHKGNEFQKHDVIQYIRDEFVGENIPFLICYCSELITSDVPFKPIMLRGILIPEIPDAVMVQYSCSQENILSLLEDHIFQKNLVIRAIFLFDTTGHSGTFYHFVHLTLNKCHKGKLFALCGGRIRNWTNTVPFEKLMRRVNGTHCIVIALPPESTHFEAYSALLTDENDRSNFFRRVKKKVVLKKHSIAVGCFCIGLSDSINWAELFSSHFPDTPITCVGVEGEYGWDNLEPSPKDEDLASVHQFTFVLAILTWD